MPRKRKRRTEQNFEYRVQKKLEKEGWLVLNCTRSWPFDLNAIKDHTPAILELKSRFTSYPDKQRRYQQEMCKSTGNGYILVQQLKTRGKHGYKILLEPYSPDTYAWKMLQESLKDFM